MSRRLWGAFVVLVVVGLYFLIWHIEPLPGNHEAVGLGVGTTAHIAHAVIGIIVLIGAVLILRRARGV